MMTIVQKDKEAAQER